jgi:hypothetical protein
MAAFYRRVFFWVFAILFLLTTPVAILYSQGYRFNQYQGIFIHSGSITVKSTPSSPSIYLNGELQPSGRLDIINNSTTLNGLRPGTYNLKVTADGYGDWEKNVEVHSGVSTEFWNVFLPQKKYSPKELNAEGTQRYFPSPFGKKVAYFKKNAENLEVWSLDMKTNEPTLIFAKPDLEFSTDPLENAEWDSNEQMLIAPVHSNGQKDFLVLDSENVQAPTLLSEMTSLSDLDRARWSPDNQAAIFFTAASKNDSMQNLYRIDLGTKDVQIVSENVKTYDLSGKAIYCLKQSDIVYKTDLNGKSEKQITFEAIPFSGESQQSRLIVYDEDRQVVISKSGEFFIHNNGSDETLKKIGDDVLGAQFSDDGKKLLYWNSNEIEVLYLRAWDVQPRRSENETEQIIRFSTPIKDVFWYRDYEHIFFSTQNKLKIAELDSRDHRIVFDIWNYNSENFSSSYDSANGIFYFLDEIEGKRKFFYLNIPLQTGFFGG